MKNSSRLLAEIDRKRSRSSSGWLAIGGLFEHAAVEMQPGQLAVDEALGAGGETPVRAGATGSSGRRDGALFQCYNIGLAAVGHGGWNSRGQHGAVIRDGPMT